MISLSGVSKSYSSVILDNVHLNIQKGEFLYVVGDSGAGKSTLLKMLYGEEQPTRGQIEVMGVRLNSASSTELQNLRRRVGLIFQDLRLIEDLSVFDNVALSFEMAKEEINSVRRTHIQDTIAMLGLQKLSKKKIKTLSGGEKQRVAAVRALVRFPEIILADEPTGSLDQEQTWLLMDALQKFHQRGATVILATHDREIVRRIRRKSCILKAGKIFVEEGVSIF